MPDFTFGKFLNFYKITIFGENPNIDLFCYI